MCGICGVLHFNGQAPDRHALNRMVQSIRHRGPDDSGLWIDAPVGLGNTRLTVIDCSAAARQPMSDDRGEVWIVYNGEVYNYLKLRQEFSMRGCNFRSLSDTETILYAYRELGVDCLQRLRGMFAFAIWDQSRRSLLIARDRLGQKPLYYYFDDDKFVFGSEIKAILAYPGVSRVVQRRILPLYLSYGYVPAPHTMFEGIYALLPGHLLHIHEGRIETKEYWAPEKRANQVNATGWGEDEWGAALMDQIREAVTARLVSDVPIGAFLSGGLDSSTIVALMVEASAVPVKTFAIGFSDESSFDESPFARRVAEHLGTEHHEFIVPASAAVDLAPKLVWHLDQPFGDSSVIPTYLLSKSAREHVTVALTGDGGDEIFAGYERFRAARIAEKFKLIPQFLQVGMAAVAASMPQGTGYRDFARRSTRFLRAARLPLPERYLSWVGIMSTDAIHDLLVDNEGLDALVHFREYFKIEEKGDPVLSLMDVNLRSYLPDDLLIKTDRMTMAASLEARAPFLDHKLVEFALQIPLSLKLRRNLGKYLLRRVFASYLPSEVLQRPKHGFGVPVGKWFRGQLREYLQHTMLSPLALSRGFFDPSVIRGLVKQHLSGECDHGHILWTLLTFEIWHQIYVDGEMM